MAQTGEYAQKQGAGKIPATRRASQVRKPFESHLRLYFPTLKFRSAPLPLRQGPGEAARIGASTGFRTQS